MAIAGDKQVNVNEAMVLRSTVGDIIAELDSGDKAAEFFIRNAETYKAVQEVWKHVRTVIQMDGKGKSFKTSQGFVVAVEPSSYEYDIDAVRELAPEAIKTEEPSQSEVMAKINGLAQEMYEAVLNADDAEWVRNYAEEFLRLSQPPAPIEAVDGRTLSGILGKGDERAQALNKRNVKRPVEWKIAVHAPKRAQQS